MRKFLPLFFIFIGILRSQAQSPDVMVSRDTTLQGESSLVVGVYSKPPYIIKGQNDTWDGISVRLWRAVADDLDLTYRFVEVTADTSQNSILQGRADILLLGDVTAEADVLVDFSHIYHIGQIGIASSQTIDLSSIAKSFFSKRFWYIAGVLSFLLLVVGVIIYLMERRRNEEQFGGDGSVVNGVGSGFWWAGVTMTTIGYGDKAPKTFFGRAIALIWMLVAMAITAVLTASLVSTVMGSSDNSRTSVPNDLRSMKVAAVEGSAAIDYLEKERVSYRTFDEDAEAVEAVNKGDLDVVIHNVPALKYVINNNPDLSLKIQPVQIDPHYYAFAFASDSPLREPLNQALLRVIKSPLWQQELGRFIPEQNK